MVSRGPERTPPKVGGRIAEEAFYRLADEDSGWEYLGGRLLMHAPASDAHEDLFRFLMTLVSVYLDATGLGVVRGSRYPMRLDAEWSPEPDLLVVLAARRERLRATYLDGPADLVVEIASEGDPGFERRVKLPRYRSAAIPEIWLVEPRERVVRVERVERQTAGDYEVQELAAGRLESSVVRGLWIDVSWLWRAELPSTLACLERILAV